MKSDVVIIGGSAAGIMAAITLRKRTPEKSVTVIKNIEKTPVPCAIPYIFGIMGSVEKDIIPDQGFIDQGIDLRPGNIIEIDRPNKEVVLENGERIAYGKLIIGTGSKPFIPPLPGIDKGNIFSISKDPIYLQQIYTALEPAQNVVVIGGGFIGVEMAEQIVEMGRKAGHKKMSPLLRCCPAA
jgi:NADPH-dependent 2,4-dienoyl-CoA reductase/sulfur reductase-like enzyme